MRKLFLLIAALCLFASQAGAQVPFFLVKPQVTSGQLRTDAYCGAQASAVNFPETTPKNVNDGTGFDANNQFLTNPSYYTLHAGDNIGLPHADLTPVTGAYTGTTQQISRWAACKWGMNENWQYAWTKTESSGWNNNCAALHGGSGCNEGGDCGNPDCSGNTYTANLSDNVPPTFPTTDSGGNFIGNQSGGTCSTGKYWASWGILQSKAGDCEYYAWPMLALSTAWNEDYNDAKWRGCMNGDMQAYFNSQGTGADYANAISKATSNPSGLASGSGFTGPTDCWADGANETNLEYAALGCMGLHFSGGWYTSSASSDASSECYLFGVQTGGFSCGPFVTDSVLYNYKHPTWPLGPMGSGGGTPVLTPQGDWEALASVTTSPFTAFVWGAPNGAAPQTNDLILLVLHADTSLTFAISGTGCTGGYWTQQSNLASSYYVYTATAMGGGSDPQTCTFTQSSGHIYGGFVYTTHQSNGQTPLIDSSCISTTGSGTSENGCTLTTSVNGELVYASGIVTAFAAPVTDLADFASVPAYWGSANGNKANAWEGVATAGSSRAINYRFGSSQSLDAWQIAIAANNGSGSPTAGYIVTSAQPDGNASVSNNGVMQLPYTASGPITIAHPFSGAISTGTVVATVLCQGGTCGTITPPSGWTKVNGIVGPSSNSEADSYCHSYTGSEGAQTWSFSGATEPFVQYHVSNIPNGACTATVATSSGSTDASIVTPIAASDGIVVDGLASNNQGQLWTAYGNPTFGIGFYGTTWGYNQLNGTGDHENYSTNYFSLHSGSYTINYSPPHGSWVSTAPTSVAMVSTFIGPTVPPSQPLWPFP